MKAVAIAPVAASHPTFEASDAVARLLCMNSLEHVVPGLPRATSLDAFARSLRKRGVAAHALTLKSLDVPFLQRPAILAMKAGGYALLRAVTKNEVTLELPRGAEVTMDVEALAEMLGGTALELNGEASHSKTIVARVVGFLREHRDLRRAALHLAALALLLNVLGMGVPIVTGMAMRDALPSGARNTLGLLVVATLGVAVHQALLGVLRSRAARFVEMKLQEFSLSRAFETTLGLPFARVHGADSGEFSASLTATEQTPAIIVSSVALPILDGIFSLGYVILLEDGVPGAGLLVAAAGLVCVLGSVAAARAMASKDAGRLVASARQRSALFELLSGIATLRASGAERRLGSRWVGLLADELSASQSSQLIGAVHRQVFETMAAVLSAGLLFQGASRCLAGTLEIGALVASLQSCMALWGAIAQLARVPIAVVGLRTLAARADMLKPESLPARPSRPPPVGGRDDAIRVDGLWFRYGRETPWLFNGYELRVARGEVVRLRWPSGQGKSTLLRLLAGLYRPSHGAVSIFGLDAEQARERVCYLPQTAVLFPGSILENLRRLSGGASVERIFSAAAVTGLDQIVKAWAMGFETCVIAGGTNLSSGQKQLIALTAAIASERPILLLDESTAHLDPLTRARLAASEAFRGRTVVTVVHDHEPGENQAD